MAGSCIGVILLVMSLEALRRASREYDAYIGRQYAAAHPAPAARVPSDTDSDNKGVNVQTTPCAPAPKHVMPTLPQQIVRSVLHMAQFAVAYIVGSSVVDGVLL
jgi:solute carrier family 31 (copper transporter), member 1